MLIVILKRLLRWLKLIRVPFHADTTTLPVQEFRAQADILKAKYGSSLGTLGVQASSKSSFDFLVSYQSMGVDFPVYDDEFCNCALQLAERNIQSFWVELEQLRQWSGRCDFVIRPVMRRFMNQLKFQELTSLLATVPVAALETDEELSTAKTPLEIIVGLVDIVGISARNNDDGLTETVKSLLEGFLSSRSDEVFLRISVGCYLFSILRGCVDILENDKWHVKANKLAFSWLVSSSSCHTGESINILKRVLGVIIPDEDSIDFHRFQNLGLPSEDKRHSSLMLLMANELGLPLSNYEWQQLTFSCLVFQSAPVYWKVDNGSFSLLGLSISDWISRTKSPVTTAKAIRRFDDALWHRIRVEHLTGNFSRLCKIAELDLMIRVCLIDHLIKAADFESANELFEITWADCSLGMYLGERDVWNAPYNYVQFLFYYKVAKLDPHFNWWHNIDLLSSLPIRGRDTDELTCQELCISCLLKNESAVPWEEVADNDPELNEMIEHFRQEHTEILTHFTADASE